MNSIITAGNYYHIYNRGVSKQVLFHDKSDYSRFMFLLLYLQSPLSFPQVGRCVKKIKTEGGFAIPDDKVVEIVENRFVELVTFCIMPNHFHVIVKAVTDDGVSRYMQKALNAYAKYFNKRYDKSGHVFQGAFKTRLIDSNDYLIYLSAYIHKNPNELSNWKNTCNLYPWSSYQDYKYNRWGSLLKNGIIIDTFKSFEDYSDYVETSGAKGDFEHLSNI